MAQRCGAPMDEVLFLSVKDDATLRTPEAIFARLPPSITWMMMLDAEFLLPASQRNPHALYTLLAEFGRLGDQRGIAIEAGHRLSSPQYPAGSRHSLQEVLRGRRR